MRRTITAAFLRAWALPFAASSLLASEPEAASVVVMRIVVPQEAVCGRVVNVHGKADPTAAEQVQDRLGSGRLSAG